MNASVISREDAPKVLRGLCEALEMPWDEFLLKLSKAYSKRCREKGKEMGWNRDE